jgi:hypothetical protein
MATPTVQVVGLAALRTDLARLAGGSSGPLNKALAQAAGAAVGPVADITRSRLPQDSGRLAGDVRLETKPTGAAVTMGRDSIRYAGWVEFGGTRRVPHTSTRAYDPRGRYLFPAALSLAAKVPDLYAVAIQRVLNGFTWTNETNDAGAVHD